MIASSYEYCPTRLFQSTFVVAQLASKSAPAKKPKTIESRLIAPYLYTIHAPSSNRHFLTESPISSPIAVPTPGCYICRNTVPADTKSPVRSQELIGKGLTAEVFAWQEGRVLKLFFDWMPAEKVEREFQVTRSLHAAGVPVPAAYEIIESEGRTGIVFERIDGISLLKLVERQPWKLFYGARLLADLHARIHNTIAPSELPAQRDQLQTWLALAKDFSPAERRAAEASLAELPEGTAVCHADFHPANILLSARGPIIIDWIGGTRGHSFADVARTSLLFEHATLPKDSPWHIHLLLKFARRLLHTTYLKRYFQLRGGTLAEVNRWRPIQLAATSAWRCSKML